MPQNSILTNSQTQKSKEGVTKINIKYQKKIDLKTTEQDKCNGYQIILATKNS